MQTALVIGTATSTCKHKSLHSQKLLVVQPQLAGGGVADGDPLIAADNTGAGVGQTVVISSDGRYARELVQSDNTPLRWTVIGICDK
jgi:ethanolamine utilization protein EutN